jgi:predicted nucleotide-binding protein (sugar kinase/HSP70/actin superfamily)
MEKAFKTEFKRLGLKLKNFRAAWDKASREMTRFQEGLWRIGRKTLDRLDGRPAIVVVARPYALYDDRLNLNLFKTLSRLGVTVIPMEFLDTRGVDVSGDYPNMYWGYGDKILRAARAIASNERLFGLYLTSFSCGPDSFILHYFSHEMNRAGRPFLELELDEHSAGAGVETRLLAFLDVIKNFKPTKRKISSRPRTRKSSEPSQNRTIYLPYMCEGSYMVAAAFEGLGIRAEVMPTYGKRGLELGKRFTSGKECFPCTVTTGDMFELISRLREAGRDVENEVAFFMPDADGPCRFGQYSRLHRMLLDSSGYQDIPILSASYEDAYSFSDLFSPTQAGMFRKMGYLGIAYGDIMERALWKTRPYELEKGEAERVFRACLRAGAVALLTGKASALMDAARDAAERFESVQVSAARLPRVGIIGEIYIRHHRYSNQDLVLELEKLGMETMTSSVCEWIEYSTLSSILEMRRKSSWARLSKWKELGALYLTDRWQRRAYARLFAPFARLLAGRESHPVSELLEKAEGLLTRELNGEAILSIGAAMAFARNGFDGVVNAMPFTCMPSTIASSILKVAMRDVAPYIDMVYDGTVLPNRLTNLCTFAHQVRERCHAPACIIKDDIL